MQRTLIYRHIHSTCTQMCVHVYMLHLHIYPNNNHTINNITINTEHFHITFLIESASQSQDGRLQFCAIVITIYLYMVLCFTVLPAPLLFYSLIVCCLSVYLIRKNIFFCRLYSRSFVLSRTQYNNITQSIPIR